MRLARPLRLALAATVAAGVCVLACHGGAQVAAPGHPGASEAVFDDYSPLSTNAELARRLLSPLAAAKIPALLAQSGAVLREQPVDLSRETFAVYVPAKAPPHGYGVLVFVPPWSEAKVPEGWATALDRAGFIFVSAARSGNEASDLGRRAPLALLGAENIIGRYRVDPERIYVAGFSGGSRVALRLALGYPDLFRGAFLDAGADPIGDRRTPPPPANLFRKFQESTRIVYVSGGRDDANTAADAASQRSLRAWCVFAISAHITPSVGHEIVSSAILSRALAELAMPIKFDPARLSACRAGVDKALALAVAGVETALASGRVEEAAKLLDKLDSRFGGLAAAASLELEEKIVAARGIAGR